jgi:hypothetical protein
VSALHCDQARNHVLGGADAKAHSTLARCTTTNMHFAELVNSSSIGLTHTVRERTCLWSQHDQIAGNPDSLNYEMVLF